MRSLWWSGGAALWHMKLHPSYFTTSYQPGQRTFFDIQTQGRGLKMSPWKMTLKMWLWSLNTPTSFQRHTLVFLRRWNRNKIHLGFVHDLWSTISKTANWEVISVTQNFNTNMRHFAYFNPFHFVKSNKCILWKNGFWRVIKANEHEFIGNAM